MVGMAMSGWRKTGGLVGSFYRDRFAVVKCANPRACALEQKLIDPALFPLPQRTTRRFISRKIYFSLTDSNLDCFATGTGPSCTQLALTRWAPAMTHK
jgi:hypothetical protein